MPAGAEPPPAPLAPDAPPTELATEPLEPAAGADACLPAEDVPTVGGPDAWTESGALVEPPERTVTAGEDVLTFGVVTEPTGAFAVTLGALVELVEGALAFTVTVGAFAEGAAVFTGTVGVVTLTVGAFTETDGAFVDTVGVVTVAVVFVVEADGVVTETLGTLTLPTGVLTGTLGVLTVTEGTLTEGKLSEEAVGTCASATTSAEARQTERAFLRDLIERAIRNS